MKHNAKNFLILAVCGTALSSRQLHRLTATSHSSLSVVWSSSAKALHAAFSSTCFSHRLNYIIIRLRTRMFQRVRYGLSRIVRIATYYPRPNHIKSSANYIAIVNTSSTFVETLCLLTRQESWSCWEQRYATTLPSSSTRTALSESSS